MAGSAGSSIPAIDQAAFPASLIDFWMNAEGSARTLAIRSSRSRSPRGRRPLCPSGYEFDPAWVW
jgi:hypothetical protein